MAVARKRGKEGEIEKRWDNLKINMTYFPNFCIRPEGIEKKTDVYPKSGNYKYFYVIHII